MQISQMQYPSSVILHVAHYDVKSKATANKKPLMVKSNKNHTKLSPKSTITIQEDEPSTPQMNGQTIKTPQTPEHDR